MTTRLPLASGSVGTLATIFLTFGLAPPATAGEGTGASAPAAPPSSAPRPAAAASPAAASPTVAVSPVAAAPPADTVSSGDTASPADTSSLFEGVERPWLYSADATAPPPWHVIGSMGVGYAQIDRGAARPFAADIAHAGAVFSAGAEVGVLRFASIHAEGLVAGDGQAVNGGALAGVTIYPLPATSPVDLAVSTGYLRELGGADGLWGRVTAAADVGPVRLALSAVGEHVFAPNRDAFDLLLTAGASARLVSFVRLGAEYVVQDLEGAWEEEEEDGGIRHFVSPTLSLEVRRHVRLTGGPAFGLSPGSPAVLGRMAATFRF